MCVWLRLYGCSLFNVFLCLFKSLESQSPIWLHWDGIPMEPRGAGPQDRPGAASPQANSGPACAHQALGRSALTSGLQVKAAAAKFLLMSRTAFPGPL